MTAITNYILIAIVAMGCISQGRRDIIENESSRPKVFKADPLTIVSGASLNPEIVPERNLENGQSKYYLVSKKVFRSHGEDIEGQYPLSYPQNFSLAYEMTYNGPTNSFLFSNNQSSFPGLELEAQADDSYKFLSLREQGKFYDVDMLHFSKAENNRSMSFLFVIYKNNIKELWSLVFSQNVGEIIEERDSFSFILGRGQRVAWRSKPKLNVCTSANLNSNSMSSWQKAWGDRFLEIKHLSKYPPFSDLNNNCIYFIENYPRNVRGLHNNTGTTFPIYDAQNNSFIDSDIFIWASEFEKNNLTPAQKNTILNRTIIHEIGHFLGLGHEENTPSVMAIKLDDPLATEVPSKYDFDALEQLY